MLLTYIREAFRNLYAAKQRTILALISISIGIGAVIALISIGIIWGEEMMRDLSKYTNMLQIGKKWDAENKQADISLKDVLSLPNATNTIDDILLKIDNHRNYHFNGHNGSVRILGVMESYQDFNQLKLKEGRFISYLDHNQTYAVIGNRVLLKEEAFNTFKGSLIGSSIKIGKHTYTIIGVLEETAMFSWRNNNSIIIPLSTAQRYFEEKNFNHFTAFINPKIYYPKVIEAVKQYFMKKNITVWAYTANEWIEQEEKQARMQTLLLGAISSISLLISGIGIMNVMLTSVMERRKEIGILRAIGARQRDIRRQFLTEAIILSLIGGTLGTGLGILSSYLVCWFNEWHFFISEFAILLGVGVSSVVGIFFGFYPAYKAAKLNPITALRSE